MLGKKKVQNFYTSCSFNIMEEFLMSNNKKVSDMFQRAAINEAQRRYNSAVDNTKRHPNSSAVYQAEEKKAFAELLRLTSKYGG